MRPRFKRLAASAVAGLCLMVPATANAGIWTTVATPTTQTITAIEYQGGDRLWFTTSSSIYKRNGGGWTKQLDQPGSNFNSIAFNSSGTLGIAVGDAGAVWRFNGSNWTKLPALLTYNFPSDSCPGSGGPYALNAPITADFSHVRWMSDSTVFVFSERGGSLMRSVNAGASFSEISRQSDGTCRINYYGDWVEDAFVLPSNPSHMLFLTGYYGRVYLSTNGLASQAAHRGYGCGDRLTVDPSNPAVMYSGGVGCSLFRVSEDGGQDWAGPQMKKGGTASSRAFDALGTTALGAGDAGYIFNSIDRREAYSQPADGAMATNDWRAVDVASASVGAVGGLNGGLLVTSRLNTIPDIVKPAGSVAGPASGVAGSTLTFTASVSDNSGGSGIDPGGFSWTSDSAAAGSGQTVAIAFPTSGYYTVRVSFRDLEGNSETAYKYVSISSPPSDHTDPKGTISGPAFAVAGDPTTFTVNASDADSGIDPASFRWTRDFVGAGVSGSTVSLTFPKPGTDTVSVRFADRAGNDASASVVVPVAPKPEDRPKPVVVDTPKPTIKKAKGGKYVIPIKGGYKLPKGVNPKLGCTGEVLFTLKKAKTLISARSTKLNATCRYAKSFSVAGGKVGAAKKVGITIRFPGNAWLAPVKRTYQVPVPKR